ncbi:DUF2764 family protein, partial [bacterium]|nr:DUF2764 family protein [candidate division CSSED10-310 bacterium]
EPAPMDSDAFFDHCRGFISDALLEQLQGLDPVPGDGPVCCSVHSAWNQHETDLRNWTVRIRSQRLRRDGERFIRPEGDLSAAMELHVTEALDQKSPVETERRLDEMRWFFLDHLSVGHDFDFEALVIYCLKLAILDKWAHDNRDTGRERLYGAVDALGQPMHPGSQEESKPENQQ